MTWCGFRSGAKHAASNSDWARRWVADAPTSSARNIASSWPTSSCVAGGGFADGCAFDADGNLRGTLVFANRIVAISPDGRAAVVVEDRDRVLSDEVTNICSAFWYPRAVDTAIGGEVELNRANHASTSSALRRHRYPSVNFGEPPDNALACLNRGWSQKSCLAADRPAPTTSPQMRPARGRGGHVTIT